MKDDTQCSVKLTNFTMRAVLRLHEYSENSFTLQTLQNSELFYSSELIYSSKKLLFKKINTPNILCVSIISINTHYIIY